MSRQEKHPDGVNTQPAAFFIFICYTEELSPDHNLIQSAANAIVEYIFTAHLKIHPEVLL
jgi:hypothetical protein